MERTDVHRVLATRAEEFGHDVTDYFAVPSFYDRLLTAKTTILVGGRGTGKTMLLEAMALEYRSVGAHADALKGQIDGDGFIGCYVKMDTYEVASFEGKGVSDEGWQKLFGHYFNLKTSLKMLQSMMILVKHRIVSDTTVRTICAKAFRQLTADHKLRSINDYIGLLEENLEDLLVYVNNPGNKHLAAPIMTNNGSLLFEVCRLSHRVTGEERGWFLLIDEYENLSASQQIVINTLMKANKPSCVFKVSMRPEGWWSKSTLRSSEVLGEPADYDLVNLETDFTEPEYDQLLQDVFRKRLEKLGIANESYLKVQTFLGKHSAEDEARMIVGERDGERPFESRISAVVQREVESPSEQERILSQLIVDDEPLRTRVHLVLLERGKDPAEIAAGRGAGSETYTQWYQHNKVGTLFLLCQEYKKRKSYAGYETYKELSSRIMRNFIMLFTFAWSTAVSEGFKPDSPRAFSVDEQTRGALVASRHAARDIGGLATYGTSLAAFADSLGRIFENLHLDPRQSEPERNHFSLEGPDLPQKVVELKRVALLHSILQETPEPTKLKSSFDVRSPEFLLNRILCPYYRLSPRKMHKLSLRTSEFGDLLSGPDEKRRSAVNAVLKRVLKTEPKRMGPFARQIEMWASQTLPDRQD
ncbi:MAG: ORC-CDC6 family AAA ATPase [Sulfobacillus sp.]